MAQSIDEVIPVIDNSKSTFPTDFSRSVVAIRTGTILNHVLKFQVNRACFHGGEAHTVKGEKVEWEEKEKKKKKE